MHASAAVIASILILTSGCTMRAAEPRAAAAVKPAGVAESDSLRANVEGEIVTLPDGRRLYFKCRGSGSPTVVMVGGAGQTSAAHDYAVPEISKRTRTCVYDRAFGRAAAANEMPSLSERVGELQQVLSAADSDPYLLVGRADGGHIVTEYTYEHPELVAGLVLIDTPCPAPRPHRHVGDLPLTVVSVHYGDAARSAAQRTNAIDQRGWLVLSPLSHQVIADSGPAIEEDDPGLVVDRILDTLAEAS